MKIHVSFLALLAILSLATATAQAALLDTAIARWQFAQFETIGTPGPNENDIADLNGAQSWATRNFGSVNSSSVGSTTPITATNSDNLALQTNTGGFLIRDLSSGGELVPTANTSYSIFARVLDTTFDTAFNGVDDILRIGSWSAGQSYYALQTKDGQARFVTNGGGSDVALTHASPLTTNSWYDITGVFDSAAQSMTVYVYDPMTGQQLGAPATVSTGYSTLASGTTSINSRNLLFFAAPSFGNGNNDGAQMEQAAVWNSALTPAEVASLSSNNVIAPPVPTYGPPVAVNINNPSFEEIQTSGGAPYNLPTGSYTAGLNNATVVDLSTNQQQATGVNVQGGYFTTNDPGGVYDDDDGEGQLVITGESGENVGYLNGTNTAMSQTLAATLQEGLYVFSADVGYPTGTSAGGAATGDLQLLVNGVEIGVPLETGLVGIGTLAELTRTYTIGAGHPLLGQPLTVSVLKLGGTTSLYFDNLALTFAAPAAAVPEPATSVMLLFGLVGLAGCARRRLTTRAARRA